MSAEIARSPKRESPWAKDRRDRGETAGLRPRNLKPGLLATRTVIWLYQLLFRYTIPRACPTGQPLVKRGESAETSNSMHCSTIRRMSLGLSALAVLGMGSVTVACSPRNEKPAETSVAPSPSNTAPSPTEKGMRTNVTRSPISAVPPGGGFGGGNGAVPCGFGPQGGSGCSSN